MSPVNTLRVAAAVLTVGLLVTPCLAADRLGTAGHIRSYGGAGCEITVPVKPECDPPPVAASLPSERRSQARVERAQQLIGAFRTEEAILELDAAVDDNSSNTDALLLRGRLKMTSHGDEAIADIERVLRFDPKNSNALATRAMTLQGQDDQAALREATRAVALDPGNVDALWIRAMILVNFDQLEEAERDLSSAVAVEPDESRTLLLRAHIRMRLGKTGGAADDATAVLALRPSRDASQIRAVVHVMSGNYAGALDDLNAVLGTSEEQLPMIAVGREGGQLELYIQRALALVRTGKPAEAKRDLQTVVKYGGKRTVLQMQLYLRSHGFPDVKLDGAPSDQLDDAMQACFINDACGRGISIPG